MGTAKYVGFYWTLPVLSLGFRKLASDAATAARQSRTIAYQRQVIHDWVADEGQGELIEEVVFLDTQPDRGTDAVCSYVAGAAATCRKNNATLLYVDFEQMCGWRSHKYLTNAIINEGIQFEPVWPIFSTVQIDGRPFDPKQHFSDHRMDSELRAADRKEAAIKNLLKEFAQQPNGRAKNLRVAVALNSNKIVTSHGRPWTADNVKKTLQRLKRKTG